MATQRNLMDDGAVIGYKPKLEYKKEMNTDAELNSSASVSTNFSGNIIYSQALTSFANNLPSIALSVLDRTINKINSLINNITPLFSSGKYGDYSDIAALITSLRYKNDDIANGFINYHFNEISGNHVPEVIHELFLTGQRLQTLSSTLKELFYGDSNITLEDASKKDNALLKNLQEFEITQNIHKINYVAIAFDSMVSRSTIVYGNEISKGTVRLSDILFQRDYNCVSPSKMSTIKRLFNEVNDEIVYRKEAYNAQQNIEIMKKTLYNYYNKRSEILTLYDLFSGSKNSIMIGRNIQRKQAHMRHAVEEVNRAYFGNKYYLDEITKLEQEKYYLRDIYAGFNYNSE